MFMQASRTAETENGFISISSLKELVRRILPTNSAARSVILAEKDSLPVREAMAKFEVFDRLLAKELAS